MKIVKAESSVVEIPFQLRGTGVGIMPTVWKSLEFALVRLEDEVGNVGWGEGFGYFTVDATKAIIDRLILPTLVGSTIEDIPAWNSWTQRKIHMFGRYGITIFAISGVDIALWDLAAKRAGVPLHKLLGSGEPRSEVPLYVSLVRYGEAGLATAAIEEALQWGFRSVKLHEIGLGEIEACRSTLGSINPMCVDVNCAWSASYVQENRNRIEKLNLAWLEEPVFPPEDFAALAALRGNPTPIAAGENWSTARQCNDALAARAVDYIQPSITKVGGMSEYIAVIDAANGAGVAVMPHSPYFGPGFFASLQAAAARPTVKALEYNFVRPDAWLADIEGLRCGEIIRVPNVPGIGFEPDLDVMNHYRRS
jgi:L-alanine-DL-glutamate epimerase-like enolase superfamily enzyme